MSATPPCQPQPQPQLAAGGLAAGGAPGCEAALPAQALAVRLEHIRRSPALASFLPSLLRLGEAGPSVDESAAEPCSDGDEAGGRAAERPADQPREAWQLAFEGPPLEALQLAFEARGCRELQRALETSDDGRRAQVAEQLRGHIGDAVRSPHANHVVQKCIEVLLPSAFQFIIDELMSDDLLHVARHKFGCRVVQRLLEHGLPDQVCELVEAMIPSISSLARHAYGNYVVQCVISHCAAEQRGRIMDTLQKDIALLCKDHYGSSVVRTVLASGAPGDAEAAILAAAVMRSHGLVQDLSRSRHGHMIIKLVVNLVELAERKILMEDLTETDGLSTSRYGRNVLQRLGLNSSKKLVPCAIHAGA